MVEIAELRARRLRSWHQTPERRIAGPEGAERLIDELGVVTLYPASSEVPNLFHAYVGDPEAQGDSSHDSPSGQVYGWRWALGKKGAAFYTAMVRGRPTWISWSLLPSVLRVRGEARSPGELYEAGELSQAALGVAEVLQQAGGSLSTGELRERAGFPKGKGSRAAYLKAVQELDTRLLLAKAFSPEEGDLDMRHALVSSLYPEPVTSAASLTFEEAMSRVLGVYLRGAVYIVPSLLAKHLKLPEHQLRDVLDRLSEEGRVVEVRLPAFKGGCYVWEGD